MMPENIRVLLVIFGLSIPFFFLLKKQACYLAFEEKDFLRRRNVWLTIVAAYCLSFNFWIFAILVAILVAVASWRESNKFSLYLMIFYAVPLVSVEVPGFGVPNYLMAVDYPKILALVVLLPCWWKLIHDSSVPSFGSMFADKCVIGYIVLPLIFQGLEEPFANTLRQAVYSFIELFLPYYLASRSLRSIKACRDTIMSFAIGILLLAPIGFFEYLSKWLLYASVPASMGVFINNNANRGELFRVMASSGHALVMGYLMVIASGLYLYTRRLLPNKIIVLLGWLTLLVGLFVPLSIGSWLGALFVLAVIYATGPSPLARTIKLFLVTLPILIFLFFSLLGEKILPLIPIITEFTQASHTDQYSQSYPVRWWAVSLKVVTNNPFFGSVYFRDLPIMQSLANPVFDIVNNYLVVASTYGLVGLAFYLGMFFAAFRSVWVGYRSCPVGGELHTLGRALLAVLLGVMFTLLGVSGYSITTINMVVIGLCVSYGDLVLRYHLGLVNSAQGAAGPAKPYGARPAWG